MPIVRNIIKDAKGSPLPNVLVTIDLGIFDVDGNFSVPQGFSDLPPDYSSDYTINSAGLTTTDNAGTWQLTLEANDNIISPSDTVYRIQETYNSVTRVYYIIVPTTGGPYWVGEILDLIHTESTSGQTFTFAALTDVNMFGVLDRNYVRYDAPTGKYVPDYIASGIPDYQLAPVVDIDGVVTFQPVVLPDDILALENAPSDQYGLRKIGNGATDAMAGNTSIIANVYQAGDVKTNHRLVSDQLLDNGDNVFINVPYAVWGNSTNMAAFGAGYGGNASGVTALSFVTTTLGGGTNGVAYSSTLDVNGGRTNSSGQYLWNIQSGTIPNGTTLNTATGVIAGTPTVNGTFTFTIRATDTLLRNVTSVSLSITIVAAAVPVTFTIPSGITTPTPLAGSAYSRSCASGASGGTGSYTFSETGSGLAPAEFIVNPAEAKPEPVSENVYDPVPPDAPLAHDLE